jgi:formate dehydrogenase major subunit
MAFCYSEAAANLLTTEALDPYGKIPEFKFCAVRVARVGGLPEKDSALSFASVG